MDSKLLTSSPFNNILTAISTTLPLFVLGTSGHCNIIEGTCLGEQFFFMEDFIF